MRTRLLLVFALAACTDGKTDDTGTAPGGDDGDDTPVDADGDGYPAGEDCDDEDASINPGATELCNDADDDCDGNIDEGTTQTWYTDADGDGHGDPDSAVEACEAPDGAVSDATDCDDDDAAVNPDADELCSTDVDDDCDGDINEDDATDAATWYADADGDGYGDAGVSSTACEAPTSTVSDATDCDDADPAVSPGAPELCSTSVDDDCDGTINEDDASDAATWYADGDGDGYGDASAATDACTAPSDTVSDDTDCDDTDGAVHPGATESCNGVDDDCNGTTDDDSVVLGDAADCAAVDCQDILAARASATDGTWWVDPAASGAPYEAYCDMTTSSGGWTLVATQDWSAANWTSTTITDASTFGTVSVSTDYKGDAWNDLLFEDVMFVNDSMFAVYGSVGDGTTSWYDFQAAVPVHNCAASDGYEWAMTDGTLSGSALCNTNLYLHPYDFDGSSCSDNNNAWGPTWSGGYNNGCPLDDPGGSGFWWYPTTWGTPWTTDHPWGTASTLRMFVR